MSRELGRNWGFCVLILLTLHLSEMKAGAQLNRWTNLASGNWEEPTNWLVGRPASSQWVMITNTISKAVGIFPWVSSTYPGSMIVSNLTVDAPATMLNTLLLNYSGVGIPLRVVNECNIGNNGSIAMLFGSLEIQGAASSRPLYIDGQLSQSGGTLMVTNGTSWLAAGGTVEINGDAIFRTFRVDNGTFNQIGGTVTATNLSIGAGTYNLTNGIVTRNFTTVGNDSHGGRFNQYGGTNLSNIAVGYTFGITGNSGTYALYGGTIVNDSVDLGQTVVSEGTFVQYGGLMRSGSLSVGGFSNFRIGHFQMQGGTFYCGSAGVSQGQIVQSNGTFIVTNGLSASGFFNDYGPSSFASISLNGGFLSANSMNLGTFGSYTQTGGTNNIATDISIYRTSCSLTAGTLCSSNTTVAFGSSLADSTPFPSTLTQLGGTQRVTNRLACYDPVLIGGGLLFAAQIEVASPRGSLTISNSWPYTIISNSESFNIQGRLTMHTASQQLGRLMVAGNSTIDFVGGTCLLKFTDSHADAWASSSILTVSNWNGLAAGGGVDRLIFGTSASGLVSSQVQQIRFINPAGFAAGTYYATILATGEVVPTTMPTLAGRRLGGNLVFNWPGTFHLQSATNINGPYVNVPNGLVPPYTNFTLTKPREFFRLAP